MTNYDQIPADVAALLERNGVTMTAVFVPQSASRHSEEKTRTLNWRITFKKGFSSFALDYSQGVGHIPAIIGKSYPLEMRAREYEASETGRYQVRANGYIAKTLPPPSAADVLHCLVLDSSVLDNSFEEFCSEFGYDTDSIRAERIYNECRKQSRDVQRVLGSALLAELSTLLQDY